MVDRVKCFVQINIATSSVKTHNIYNVLYVTSDELFIDFSIYFIYF